MEGLGHDPDMLGMVGLRHRVHRGHRPSLSEQEDRELKPTSILKKMKGKGVAQGMSTEPTKECEELGLSLRGLHPIEPQGYAGDREAAGIIEIDVSGACMI